MSEMAVENPEWMPPRIAPEMTSQVPDGIGEYGIWTFDVAGGPAFAVNAATALRISARNYDDGPIRQSLLRLAIAIDRAQYRPE